MKRTPRNCYEVLPRVEHVLHDTISEATPHFMLGGIPTAALRDPRTILDFEERRIIAPKDVSLSTQRKNRTRRDIDILVVDTLTKEAGEQVVGIVDEAIDESLDVSVFGIDKHEDDIGKSRLLRHGIEWLSRRTVDDNGVHRYELFPLVQSVQPESYEPWRLSYNSSSEGISVLHPVGHALAYRMRSISSVRAKDTKKLAAMEHEIYKHPQAKEALNDGEFQEWRLFAGALARLRSNYCADTRDYHGLINGMTNRSDIAVAEVKSSLLATVESIDVLRGIAQSSRMQRMLKPLTGNY